jgi:hypothetical protein
VKPVSVNGLEVLIRALREGAAPVAIYFGLIISLVATAEAATVTRQVYVTFDGTLAGGNAYVLGPGETDVTGTFRKNGSATIAAGVADVPGDVDASSGFLFSSASLPALTTTNWVSEAVLVPDVPAGGQPGPFNHFLDVRGDLFFRYNGNTAAPKFTQFGYWDGATEPSKTTPDLSTEQYTHVALVWNAGTRTLEGFMDGSSLGTVSSGNIFSTPSVNVGYGFFARTGFLNRAFDGKLASVAFSTFTGTFNPGLGATGDFQLDSSTAPSLVLELVVNTVSGEISIVNNTSSALALKGYEITSARGSLDVSRNGWHSLQDQNIDPVMGGDAPGETWQEGAGSSSMGIYEGFLLGSSPLDPGESLTLGRAYDEVIAGRDLQFNFRLDGRSGVLAGTILYDDTPPPPLYGDYDNNGVVDAADYTVWRDRLDTSAVLPNDATPEMVTSADYEVWKSHFGERADGGTGVGEVGTSAVPETSSLALALTAILLSIALAPSSRLLQPRNDSC